MRVLESRDAFLALFLVLDAVAGDRKPRTERAGEHLGRGSGERWRCTSGRVERCRDGNDRLRGGGGGLRPVLRRRGRQPRLEVQSRRSGRRTRGRQRREIGLRRRCRKGRRRLEGGRVSRRARLRRGIERAGGAVTLLARFAAQSRLRRVERDRLVLLAFVRVMPGIRSRIGADVPFGQEEARAERVQRRLRPLPLPLWRPPFAPRALRLLETPSPSLSCGRRYEKCSGGGSWSAGCGWFGARVGSSGSTFRGSKMIRAASSVPFAMRVRCGFSSVMGEINASNCVGGFCGVKSSIAGEVSWTGALSCCAIPAVCDVP